MTEPAAAKSSTQASSIILDSNLSFADENGDAKDCHNVVKSSGIGAKRGNLCGEHQNRMNRRTKISVACQTDDTDLYASLGSANCSRATLDLSPRKDVDGSKPEGTLRLMIQNFRNMNDTVRGPGKTVNGVPWKIMVMPRQHVVQKKGTQKCLGFFLQCCPDAYSDSWSCQAAAELRLISQKQGVPNFTRKTNHVYTAKENDWGYSCFMTWADILDESQGYIKDDKVILEVYVKAEPPKNVLTHDAFEKKIQDYMRLADMQSSRGLIDKAIEVNQSALKFCKDKDENCKQELEAQKAKLIELKLKQSIERIEKGKEPGKDPEDDGTNLNALRQALTGNMSAAKKSINNVTTATKIGSSSSTTTTTTTTAAKKSAGSSPNADTKKADKLDTGDGKTTINDNAALSEQGISSDSDCGGDDDDSPEELCDTCLQETLEMETINSSSEDIIETSDTSVQTDLLPATIPRSPQKTTNTAAANNPPTVKLRPPTIAVTGKDPKRRLSTGDAGAAAMLRISGDGSDASRVSAAVASRWTAEKEAELLDLITLESRASLDSIRDTLERLVHLAQDGDVPPGLEMDLEQLKTLRNEQLKQRSLEPPMDVIEIPPAETHIVDLGEGADTETTEAATPVVAKSTKKNAARKDASMLLVDRCGGGGGTQDGLIVGAARQSSESPLLLEAQSHYSEEEYALIKHAKQIVETKAEELVTKYSQLIEQSEATRLAETVKKVEKRMKDIEKQTMTCRKELADECDRHYKEEQKMIKSNKLLQSQLSQSNEKCEKLNAQLKERKNEIKRLEKRLKTEGQTNAENAELTARIEALEKEVATLQKRLADEQKKHQRDTQSLIDSKKHLQQELSALESDVDRLNTQIDEKTQMLRKAEHRFEQQSKQTQSALKDSLERAKKAEVNLLEFKLEIGIKLLVRAQEDCQNNIKQLDDLSRRQRSHQDAEALRKFMLEWQKTRDEIGKLIANSRSDFAAQIDAVRAGKQLAQLPVIHVAKPPPAPKPAAAAIAAVPSFDPQQQQQSVFPSYAELKPQPQPIGARPVAANNNNNIQHSSLMSSPIQSSVSLPPPSLNGPTTTSIANSNHLCDTTSGASPMNLQQQQQQQMHRMQTPPPPPPSNTATTNAVGGGTTSSPSSVGAVVNGFSPWDPITTLAETLFATNNRSFTSFGGSGFGSVTSSNGWTDTWGGTTNTAATPSRQPAPGTIGTTAAASPAVVGNSPFGNGPSSSSTTLGTYQQQQTSTTSQQQQQQQAPGQWGVGWGYQHVTSAPPPASPPTCAVIDAKNHRPISRGTAASPNAAHGMVTMDSRGSSPITAQNERHKRVEALMDQLRATFPNISQDVLREYVNEYRNQRVGKSLKGMSIETALNGVVALIIGKQQQSGWNSSSSKQHNMLPPPMSNAMSMDTFVPPSHHHHHHHQSLSMVAPAGAGADICAACGDSLRSSGQVVGLKCRHRFHSKCVQEWLATQQTCPSCGKFNPSPDEYPELA